MYNIYDDQGTEASAALRAILANEARELQALPLPPRFALFDSAEGKAKKAIARADIQRRREAIEEKTLAEIKALAAAGDLCAKGFLDGMDPERQAARHARYDGGY